MHTLRARSLIAVLIISASALEAEGTSPAVATAPATAIVAPARLRQGDPLLAWIVTEAPVSEASAAAVIEARLLNPEGKAIAIARCFVATALLGRGEVSLAGRAWGGPAARPILSPRPPLPEVTVLPRRILYGALLPLPMELPPGGYKLVAAGGSTEIDIDARDFPFETIELNEANSNLRTVPSERKVEEARKLYAILEKVDDSAVYAETSSLLFPVAGGWKSAGFGDRRRYVYADGSSERSVHAGIDWAVVTGTAVLACARGKVVLAADREVTGKTVVLEHLPGLYSLYFHLSSLEIAEGAIVERGAEIARSGSTGMATGPHLHWELRAKGDAVDPAYWLGPPLLDKPGVTAIMYGLIEGR